MKGVLHLIRDDVVDHDWVTLWARVGTRRIETMLRHYARFAELYSEEDECSSTETT